MTDQLDEWNDLPALAAWLKIPPRTLYDWRRRGVGPKAHVIGRHLRYRRSDVESWLEAQGKSAEVLRRAGWLKNAYLRDVRTTIGGHRAAAVSVADMDTSRIPTGPAPGAKG